ncbi:hypothetical protein [Methanobrevibacter sp.]|uniref:hypothetical protein n=1 Tax=Methanobrevibacter sp. TaxID=66852 RepID=UPI00388ED756
MDLNFEIKKQIIKRLDENILVNKSKNYVKANFTFSTKEWRGIEKFVIFKDSWGHAYTQSLGQSCDCTCDVPNDVLKGTHIKISVYGGDRVTSNELTILLIPSGYTTEISPASEGSKDVFVKIFEELESKIDQVEYTETSIVCYANNEIICEIPIITTVDDELSEISLNPVQNKVISNALNNKEDIFDFVEKMDITIQNLIGRV